MHRRESAVELARVHGLSSAAIGAEWMDNPALHPLSIAGLADAMSCPTSRRRGRIVWWVEQATVWCCFPYPDFTVRTGPLRDDWSLGHERSRLEIPAHAASCPGIEAACPLPLLYGTKLWTDLVLSEHPEP